MGVLKKKKIKNFPVDHTYPAGPSPQQFLNFQPYFSTITMLLGA